MTNSHSARPPLGSGGFDWITSVGSLIVISVLCWFFPIFHIRPITNQSSETKPDTQPPTGDTLSQKLESYASGVPVETLWAAIENDFSAAQKEFGQQAGLGGAWYFRVQGSGSIVSVDQERAIVAIAGSTRQVHLELGVVVDNTVRDSIGVKARQFVNSQAFNAFSAELNRQVEEEIIKPNRTALVQGATISFVGCTKISSKSDVAPLKLIPIQLHVVGAHHPGSPVSAAAVETSGDGTTASSRSSP